MTTTVATKTAYGTVEYFAGHIRAAAERSPAYRETDIMTCLLGSIQSAMKAEEMPADRKVEIIGNVFAAEDLVRAELDAAA